MFNYIRAIVLILLILPKTVFSNESINKSMNNLLSAVANITEERAKQLNWLNISYTMREDLCGFRPWSSNFYANSKLYIYFPEMCESIRYKWSQNLQYDKALLKALKKDILNNSVHMLYGKFYKKTLREIEKNNIDAYKEAVERIKENGITDKRKIAKELILVGIKDYSHDNSDYASKLKYNEFLTETKKILYDFYSIDKIKKEFIYKKYLSKYKGFYSNNIKVVEKINSLNSSDEFDRNDLIYVLSIAAYFEIKNNPVLSNIGYSFEEFYNTSFNNSYSDIAELIVDGNSYYNKFVTYYKYLTDDSGLEERVLDITKDYESKIKNNYKAIRILMMFASVLESKEPKDAEAILKSFASDINSREMRYWERVWSVGTMAGFSLGNVTDSSNAVSAFIPFGVLTTRGESASWMFHFFDLGQYLNYSDQDESVEWKDAVMPGVSYIFARYRRYAIDFGVDVSYFPHSSDSQSGGDYRFSAFVAMEVPIWELN